MAGDTTKLLHNGCHPRSHLSHGHYHAPTQVLCGGSLELDAVTTGGFSTSYWTGGQGEFDPPNGISTTYTLPPSGSGNVALSFCIVGLCGDTVCDTYQLEVITLAPAIINVDPSPISCGATAALSATVQGTNNFFWNGGTGVFSSPTGLSTNYTPGATESGTVDLEFVAAVAALIPLLQRSNCRSMVPPSLKLPQTDRPRSAQALI